MRKHINLKTNLTVREEKWHKELNSVYSTEFWNKTYALTADIKYDNRIKWIQFQINRNSLYTNYRVNKFNNQVSPLCTFCIQSQNMFPQIEHVSHLFVTCPTIQSLWHAIVRWLESVEVTLPTNKQNILFGIHNQPFDSLQNYVILCTKYYIWVMKQKQQSPTLEMFKKYFLSKLDDLKNVYTLLDNNISFNQWLNIYRNLL